MFGALKRGFRSLASLILVRNVVGELQPKKHLRHRAVSLRQHGFLVIIKLFNSDEFRRHKYWGQRIRISVRLIRIPTVDY